MGHHFRNQLAGVVALPAPMEESYVSLAGRIASRLREEQAKPSPDTALIACLCDCARAIDELIDLVPRPVPAANALARQLHEAARQEGLGGSPVWPLIERLVVATG